MLPDGKNRQAHCSFLISSREFCRHIPSYSTTQAASNKVCLHSLCWGVSLKQCVTCVTISNKGNVV